MANKVRRVHFSITDLLINASNNPQLLYDQCRGCNFIFPCRISEKKNIKEGGCICPKCKKDSPTIWPSVSFFGLLSYFYELKKLSVSQQQLFVIVFCSIFEGLFDTFLERYLVLVERTPLRITKFLLRRYPSIDSRVTDLYKKIIGKSFRDELIILKFMKFYDEWELIKRARNDFVHLKEPAIKKAVIRSAFRLMPSMLSIFMRLNNKYLFSEG